VLGGLFALFAQPANLAVFQELSATFRVTLRHHFTGDFFKLGDGVNDAHGDVFKGLFNRGRSFATRDQAVFAFIVLFNEDRFGRGRATVSSDDATDVVRHRF